MINNNNCSGELNNHSNLDITAVNEVKKPKTSSRFHNLTKLFMYNILSMFTKENLHKLKVPILLQEHLRKLVMNVKRSAKKIKKNFAKSDFFNHTHYNALFLHLNADTIEELSRSEREIEIHQFCFRLNLLDDDLDFHQLEYINIIKKFAYEVVKKSLDLESQNCEGQQNRLEYMQRALKGIKKLSEGIIIHRF